MNTKFGLIESEWKDDHKNLPSESDFDPYDGDLDAQHAWQEFGGLTRAEVLSNFWENPGHYSEDFMFMGFAAFAYYYPVIERFLCEESNSVDFSHRYAWVMGESILYHFEGSDVSCPSWLAERLLTLSENVSGNVARYSFDDADRDRINDAWSRLAATVKALATPQSHS